MGVMVLGGSCPGGNCPRGNCPMGVMVLRGSCPRGSCPQGSCPRGSCPRGSCPRTIRNKMALILLHCACFLVLALESWTSVPIWLYSDSELPAKAQVIPLTYRPAHLLLGSRSEQLIPALTAPQLAFFVNSCSPELLAGGRILLVEEMGLVFYEGRYFHAYNNNFAKLRNRAIRPAQICISRITNMIDSVFFFSRI